MSRKSENLIKALSDFKRARGIPNSYDFYLIRPPHGLQKGILGILSKKIAIPSYYTKLKRVDTILRYLHRCSFHIDSEPFISFDEVIKHFLILHMSGLIV